jgi:hypothetical protein
MKKNQKRENKVEQVGEFQQEEERRMFMLKVGQPKKSNYKKFLSFRINPTSSHGDPCATFTT